MKKLIYALLCACMLASLTACGGDNSGDNKKETAVKKEENNANKGEGFAFDYKGTKITMNAETKSILAALGEPKSMTEEPSCAFDGNDKTYYYGSFYMQTYTMKNVDYVYCLWFADDTVSTEEGIFIGATEDEVKKAYGEDSYNGKNAYIVTKGDSKLTVIVKDGAVSNITYDAIVE